MRTYYICPKCERFPLNYDESTQTYSCSGIGIKCLVKIVEANDHRNWDEIEGRGELDGHETSRCRLNFTAEAVRLRLFTLEVMPVEQYKAVDFSLDRIILHRPTAG